MKPTKYWVSEYGQAEIPPKLWRKYRKAFRKDGNFDGRKKRLAAEARETFDNKLLRFPHSWPPPEWED